MLDIYTWSVFITGVFFTSFGLFAFIKNYRDLSTKTFALLSLAFAIWSFSWFILLYIKDDLVTAIFFAKLLAFGATFIPVFYLHWALAVLEIHKKRTKLLVFSYIVTFFFASLSYTDLYVPGVRSILFFKYWPIAGPGYTIFIIFGYFGLILYAVAELVYGFKVAKGEKKYQIGYLLTGSFAAFIGGITNFPLMYGYTFMQPFGLFAVMTSPFIFSYASIKYKLLDIKIFATQFFLGALNIVFVINFIIAQDTRSRFFDALLFVMVLYFSILVMQSVRREIEARKKIEILATDLKKANIRLSELDQQKSEFVSLASHQLRGPLTAIKGYGSMILEGDFGEVPAEIKDVVSKIYKSTQDLVIVVGDYLNISRIEQGRMEYDFTVFDMKTLVTTVITDLRPTIELAKLTIDFDYDSKIEYIVNADIGKIKQVVGNLIDNAIKYTPHGGLHVWLTKTPLGKVLISISDTGIGIPVDVLPHLFEKFGRAPDASKTNIMGTGLGLYVAKKMIEAHHGRVWAESAGAGKGSTFFVELDVGIAVNVDVAKV